MNIESPRIPAGRIRDAIVRFLAGCEDAVSVGEIESVVVRNIGVVPRSSIRSYLSLNTPDVFERTERGYYRLKKRNDAPDSGKSIERLPSFFLLDGAIRMYRADCFDWLRCAPPRSIQAVVTDSPYGLVEFSEGQKEKLRSGKGGVWRIPPSFDGNIRSPLPRFTTLSDADLAQLRQFFEGLGLLLYRTLVPGANVVVASNPLVQHCVADALSKAGLEARGAIVRCVMTMRGGDRPKNAHEEFSGVSVMPRSMWEPWLVFRRPLQGRVQDNLRTWRTGGFRRPSPEKPFGDLIDSRPASKAERALAPHPSLKPQLFLRQIVRAALPLGEGIILDPFAGSGSTLAAGLAQGYRCIGVESDEEYFEMSKQSILALSEI